MKKQIIREPITIFKTECPFAHLINPTLHKIIKEEASILDKGAIMMSWQSFIPEFNNIVEWIISQIATLDVNDPTLLTMAPSRLELRDCWGQIYYKGHYQEPHLHVPSHWSFCYYVNTPKGSAPMIFERTNTRIHPKSGLLVVFPSMLRHYVPKNKCEERSLIAGNLNYVFIDAPPDTQRQYWKFCEFKPKVDHQGYHYKIIEKGSKQGSLPEYDG